MPKKDTSKDSTTDFFLKFINKQKEEKSKEPKIKKDIPATEDTVSAQDKTINALLKAVNMVNILLDRILASNLSVKILSFVMAIVMVFVINGGSINSILASPTNADTIREVPVAVENLNSDYIVTGAPKTVDVTMIGTTLDIYTTRARNEYEVYLDLSNVKEGENTVPYRTRNFPSTLQVFVDQDGAPITEVRVNVSRALVQKFSIETKAINQEKLGANQSITIRSIDHTELEIKGPSDVIGSVHRAVAEVEITDEQLKQKTFETKAEIKVYDRSEKELTDQLDLSITEVTAQCVINNYSKEVAIVPVINGELPEGVAISKLVPSRNKIQIYGSEEAIKDKEEVYANIDVEDIETEDIDISNIGENEVRTIENVPVVDSDGNNIESKGSATVDVEITLDQEVTRSISDIPIIMQDNALITKFADGEDKATVQVTGAKSIVDKMVYTDFRVYIDGTGLDVGQHTKAVNVEITNTPSGISDNLLKPALISKKELIITLER